MRVLITGVNGFIASNLARYLKSNNFEVYGTSSKKFSNIDCIKTFHMKIGDLFDVGGIHFDWAIHCVYDKTQSVENNSKSTISWAKELKKNGVKNQIFISSIRAINGNSSNYSLIKKKVETWFLKNDLNIVRPGLVVGNGGLFKKMIINVKILPLLPIVNRGNQNVKLIGINDLMNEINNILINNSIKKELNIFYLEKFILKNVLKDIAKYYDKKVIFIQIPYFVVFYFLRAFEIFHINIGFTSVNIQGLYSKELDIKSDIKYSKDFLQIMDENFCE
jgi:nucleoside-diphosphate-sugar epimerase